MSEAHGEELKIYQSDVAPQRFLKTIIMKTCLAKLSSGFFELTFIFVAACLFSGCAGPTTPFGAVPLKKSAIPSLPQDDEEDDDDRMVASVQDPKNYAHPRIVFSPKRQLLHDKAKFSLIIEDPQGIPKDFEIMVIYNGIDVTKKFLSQASASYEGHSTTRMRLTMYNLRILPNRENRIDVVYWRTHNATSTFARYMPPYCDAFKAMPVVTTGTFREGQPFIETISRYALDKRFNPSFVTGLIAQESGFNTKAVSHAKALGLTQVTPLGEAEIVKDNANWPRYPNIAGMPSPILKMNVMAGKINGSNEWRLDPSLSIQGGVEYLKYLNEYWRRPQAFSTISGNFRDTNLALSQLILASYNSGPTRVFNALQRHGKRWLHDGEDLDEARKYVGRVTSYCDYFAHGEESENESSP